MAPIGPSGAGRREGPAARIAAASLAAHAALIALLFVAWPPARPAGPSDAGGIAVELLTPEEFAAMLPAPAASAVPETPSPAAPPPPAERPAAMVEATTMLSGRALADPRSAQARAALRAVDGEERMIQLCDLEAMEQIQSWRPDFRPDRVVPYATAEVRIDGDAVVSDGAAFRSEGAWYELAFHCDLSDDHERVAGFRFMVGKPIPRREWPARNLPSEG
jgi:hypothetical protein